MIATVAFDLTIAIIIGIVFSIFVYLFKISFRPTKTKIEAYESQLKNEIKIEGSIFFNNVGKIEKMILSTNAPKAVISLENVVYIDTSAIEMLHEASKTLAEGGKALIIHTPSDKVAGVMSKTGLIKEYTPICSEE